MARLADFERADTEEDRDRYVLHLPGADGVVRHELIVSSPRGLAEELLGEGEIEVTVAEDATPEDWDRQVRSVHASQQRHLEQLTGLTDVRAMLKPHVPDRVAPETTAVVALRRTRSDGTMYRLALPPIFLPIGTRLVVALPPVCTCFAVVLPTSGDPDLGFCPNAIACPGGMVSTNAGLTPDSIFFGVPCFPWLHFIPFFRVVPFPFAPPGSSFVLIWGGADFLGPFP
jgi:hypothetical protein